jgi:CubicO group peptidase (beta-lactamase class C family)
MRIRVSVGPRLPVSGALALLWAAGAVAAPAGPELHAATAAFVAKERIPAAHVTVLQGDRVLFREGFGESGDGRGVPDADTIFPIASISKQFAAATIVALVDDGQLRLDDRVRDWLPEWFRDDADLRVRHLLEQTSGLADFLWLDGYRALADESSTPVHAYVALAAAQPRRFAPGARWAYSNTNYKALALIAQRATGLAFDTLTRRRVLGPAGIERIVPCHDLAPEAFVPGVTPDDRAAPLDASRAAYTGDGGLCASAADLARWARHALAPRDGLARRLAAETALADGTRVPYGFGVSTRPFLGRTMRWHGGNLDGHSALLAYDRDEDLTVVILTARGYVWLTELLPALIDVPLPNAAARRRVAPLPSDAYDDGLFRIDIRPDGDALKVNVDLIGELRFVPAGAREFIAESQPATFRIRFPPRGGADRFEFDWGEVRSYAHRVTGR